MFSVTNGPKGEIAVINGQKGKYDGKINNPNVLYGRNAIDNYKGYVEAHKLDKLPEAPKFEDMANLPADKFEKKLSELGDYLKSADVAFEKLPPLKFQYRYSPETPKGVNLQALMAASYGELDQMASVPVEMMNKLVKNSFGEDVDAKVMDLNKDNQIDIAEYATTILTADALSSPDGQMHGVITNDGQNKSVAYLNKKNYDLATKQYQGLYECFDLGKAQKDFLSDPNNTIK